MIPSWRERKKREREKRIDKFIGKPIQRPYCEINGHSFIDGACVVCGEHR